MRYISVVICKDSLELEMANQGTSTVPVVLAQFLSVFVLFIAFIKETYFYHQL